MLCAFISSYHKEIHLKQRMIFRGSSLDGLHVILSDIEEYCQQIQTELPGFCHRKPPHVGFITWLYHMLTKCIQIIWWVNWTWPTCSTFLLSHLIRGKISIELLLFHTQYHGGNKIVFPLDFWSSHRFLFQLTFLSHRGHVWVVDRVISGYCKRW